MAERASAPTGFEADGLYIPDRGWSRIRIGVTKEQDPLADHLFRFEYQFEWQQLPKVNAYACTYLTLENRQRFDYLPAVPAMCWWKRKYRLGLPVRKRFWLR